MEGVINQVKCRGAFLGEEMEYVEGVSIYFEGDKIVEVEEKRSTHLDSHFIAAPSFINSHTHVGDSFIKDSAFNKPLREIVAPPSGIKHRMLECASPSEIIGGVNTSLAGMIENGTCAFMDFREGGIDGYNMLSQAIEQVCLPLCSKILARPERARGSIEKLVNQLGGKAHFAGLNISSPNSWNDELLKSFKDQLSSNNELLFATHVSETPDNPASSREKFGLPDAARIESHFHDVSDRVVLIHCNHVNREEIESIVNSKFSAVFCPRVASLFHNFNLEDPPYKYMMESGINCCLGTDNIMLNSPDMFQELNFFTRILKSLYKDWLVDPGMIMKMVTINAAKALHVDSHYGSITKGKTASFYLLDFDSTNLKHSNNPCVSFVTRATSSDIVRHYMSGKEVFKRG